MIVTPQVRFHAQPFRGEDDAGSIVTALLDDQDLKEVTIVVAWARYRGVARIQSGIDRFRGRGGRLRVVLGLDEGGATRPGLLAALRASDDPYVFHDPLGGTFHPKVYFAEGSTKALLLVGSSNLTPGGLYFNVEASTLTEFQLPGEAEHEALVGARHFIQRLVDDSAACRPLTEELVEELVSDPRFRVSAHERLRIRGAAPAEGADPEDVEATGFDGEPSSNALFGRSQATSARVPPLTAAARADLASIS